jgi:DNA-binding transcriptional MerR regulator
MEGFTAHQATRLTGCTPRQLRYWDQIGLVIPTIQSTGGRPGVPRLYAFRDLVALRCVKSLLDGGMSLQRIRRAFDYLNRRADLDRHLAETRLVTDGSSIFKVAKRNGEIIDLLKEGQMAFFVTMDEVASTVEVRSGQFREDRDRFIRALREAAVHVRVSGGRRSS